MKKKIRSKTTNNIYLSTKASMKIGTNVRNSEVVHVLRKIVITMRNSNFVTKSVKHSKSKNEKV